MSPEDKEKIDPALRRIMEIPDDQELPDDALIDVMLRALESQQLLIRSSAVHQLVNLGRKNPAMALAASITAHLIFNQTNWNFSEALASAS